MKALTVWQPWASLIAGGAKPYEFRHWDFRARAPRLVGERIAIHAGARPLHRKELIALIDAMAEDDDGTGLIVEKAVEILRPFLDHPEFVLKSHVLCTAVIGTPILASKLVTKGDSDRVDHSIYGWPLADIQRLEPPVPVKGAQGFWNWNP